MAAAKKRKKKNKNKQKSSAAVVENGDASSTTSTLNDAAESLDHSHEPNMPISEATDTQLLPSPVTSSTDMLQPEVVSICVGMSNGLEKAEPTGPVLIHVGDKTSGGLPNGLVSSRSKVVSDLTVTSKGTRPNSLGEDLVKHSVVIVVVCCMGTMLWYSYRISY